MCGKGIAFKKKVGEFVDVSAINNGVLLVRREKRIRIFSGIMEEIPVNILRLQMML